MYLRKIMLVLFFLSCLSFSGCKKWQHQYPEDLSKSQIKPKDRLIGKVWEINKVIFNGTDVTDSIRTMVPHYSLFFGDHEGPSSGQIYYYGVLKNDLDTVKSMIWFFQQNESKLVIAREFYPSPIMSLLPCYLNPHTDNGYVIKRLEDRSLNIETVIDSSKLLRIELIEN